MIFQDTKKSGVLRVLPRDKPSTRNSSSKKCGKKMFVFARAATLHRRTRYHYQAARGEGDRRDVASTACVERVCASALRDLRKRLDRGSIRRAWEQWKRQRTREPRPLAYVYTRAAYIHNACVSDTRGCAHRVYSRDRVSPLATSRTEKLRCDAVPPALGCARDR